MKLTVEVFSTSTFYGSVIYIQISTQSCTAERTFRNWAHFGLQETILPASPKPLHVPFQTQLPPPKR